jgi:hypothetical protein
MGEYTYRKHSDDVKYRKVSLRSANIPEFVNFSQNEFAVQDDMVVEVLDSKGNTRLYYDSPISRLVFRQEGDHIRFDGKIPLHRLYIRDRRYPHVLYKVPTNLPKTEDGSWDMLVPEADSNIELYGDDYFMTVYYI